ncbi:MAG: type II toxin-antitoxin system Phd/YefM family antitoxin [Gammaproteobacteria bacterium]|nr:type II toxin-antitoxin system Phd/YefM family antitoxin [Gammaproteobacteria bacterium]
MATKTVNVHEAKTHLSRLLEDVARGEEVVLAKAGKPCAKLVPFAPNQEPRQPGLIHGVLGDEFFDPLPEEELAAWEGRG